MPIDPFINSVDSPMAPAENCFAIAPSDTADLPRVTKAIFIGQGGDVALRSVDGDQTVVFRNLVAGSILDVRVAKVAATGTTASSLIGLA